MDLQYGDQGGVHGTGVMYPQHPQNDRKRGREDIATPLEGGPMNQNGEEEDAEYEVEDWGQLPSVDDMEVAALAAEAAMEAVSLRAEGRRPPQASSSDESSSGEDESSSEEESSEFEEMPQSALERIAVTLDVTGEGRVSVGLTVADDDVDSLDGSDIVDPQVLKEMLERMNEDGEDARAAAKEAAELEASMPSVEPLDVEIAVDDRLQAAGSITAVLANQIIVQAPKDSRAVDEGSVLCLPDRHGLGRVEEVFGPVDEPLYTLRYAGGGEMPPEVAAGAQVFSVERFSTYVLPESVQAAPVEDGLEEEGMEFEFSDDDAEAVFQKLNAGAAGGPHSRVAGAAVERTSQPVSRGRGRFGGDPRPARGSFRGREHSRGGRGGGRGSSTAQFATPPGAGMAGSRRGRGRNAPPGAHPGRGAQGRGFAAPGATGPPGGPPPGGQWVWIAQDTPQEAPQPSYPPQQPPLQPQQYPLQQPRPAYPPQQYPLQRPQGRGFPQPAPMAYDPQQGPTRGLGAPQGGFGGYAQPFGGSPGGYPGSPYGPPQGLRPVANMPVPQNGQVPPVWPGGGGQQQQWARGGGGNVPSSSGGIFYPNGLPE